MAAKKRKKKFVMECTRYITDFRGYEIAPGCVVGVSRSGDYSRALEAYIVSSVGDKSIKYAGLDFDYDYSNGGGWQNRKMIIHGARPTASYSKLFDGEIQQHIVVIENPLHAIHNPQMKEIINISAHLKEDGFFPEDYKLGQPVMEYSDE